ncbi:hypothetical protein PHLCEN_2v9667 [Hermanssonia centrifuga]|uniref:HTH CENPB-type domain-containing protein n=1 Tax=Hermanssonia centrifuga TaxID=98765 RepID=A0A2R6NQ37_9APHY|nr:hypothetical protein PHLCEN_2v9667 [Hermanssonia centrifuga]
MGRCRRPSGKTQSGIDDNINWEARYSQACDDIKTGKFSGYAEAARHHGLKYQTLCNRFLGYHRPATQAHQAQQILSPAQEEVLVDWCIFLGLTGHPVHKKSIRFKVKQLSGRDVGPKYINAFLKRHKKDLRFCKPAGLDPKRAQAFNPTAVHEHFKLVD